MDNLNVYSIFIIYSTSKIHIFKKYHSNKKNKITDIFLKSKYRLELLIIKYTLKLSFIFYFHRIVPLMIF